MPITNWQSPRRRLKIVETVENSKDIQFGIKDNQKIFTLRSWNQLFLPFLLRKLLKR